MWRQTTRQDRNRALWEEELEEFVPAKVLDFHVHLFNEATLPRGTTFSCAGHPIRHYDIDDLRTDLAETYPGRETLAVCFGTPHAEYDRSENNRYVASVCDGRRFHALRLLDPSENAHAVRRDVEEHGFLGFKPYLNYVPKADRNQVEITEMLPDHLMRIADELGLIVMLHIPRRLRLADPLNQRQLPALCRRFPRAKIVLAHIGRAYYLRNVVGHLDNLVDLPNLFVDISMLNNWEVLEHTFRVFGRDRLLFATDTPIAMAPGKSVEINDQYTYVTPVPWHLSISDDHGKLVFTSFLYEQLRAMKKAIARLELGRDFAEAVFYKNGLSLLESVPPRKEPS